MLERTKFEQWFSTGQVFAYPTEGVWGLGCDPASSDSLQRILDLKQRPSDKGLILIAASVGQCHRYIGDGIDDAEFAQRVANQNELAVTYLLPKSGEVPYLICGNSDLVAIRITKHPLVRELCEWVNSPLISTSANPAGHREALNEAEAREYFGDAIKYVSGDTLQPGKPSKIINYLTNERVR